MMRYSRCPAVLALALLFAVPSVAAAQKIKVGHVNLLSDAGIYIAMEKGYFREQGLEMEMIAFPSSAQMMAPLSRGQLDIATGGVSAQLFTAVGRELPVVVTADKGSVQPNHGFTAIVVRKDLVDSGAVKSLRDVKGRKVAFNAPGSINLYQWQIALNTVGLSLDDVETAALSFPSMVTALETKAIDAANIVEPLASAAVAKGAGVKLFPLDRANKPHQVGVIFYQKDFVAKHPEVGRRWMIAYIKALRLYNEALVEGGSKREQVISILMMHTMVKTRATYDAMAWPGLDPNGTVMVDSLREIQEFFLARGTIKSRVRIEEIVDESIARAAVRALGGS